MSTYSASEDTPADAYPIEIDRINLECTVRGSAKFYELTKIRNSDGTTALVRRWGKIKAFGEILVAVSANPDKIDRELEKLFEQKRNKGYVVAGDASKKTANDKELRLAIGPALFAKLPGSLMRSLGLEHLADGRKELEEPTYAEDGTYKGPRAARTHSPEEIAAAKAAEAERERQEAVKTYASNPMFGRF